MTDQTGATKSSIAPARAVHNGSGRLPQKSILERAFELADTPDCRTLTAVLRALKREGYTEIDAHFDGQLIRAQIFARLSNKPFQRERMRVRRHRAGETS